MTITTRTHTYTIEGAPYEGFLALPSQQAKAVIVIAHAWAGLTHFEQEKAELLANWGYAAFAMDVYGEGKRGNTTEECQALMNPLASDRPLLQARLAASLAVAKEVSGMTRAGAIGFCFGGLSVLDMARANQGVEAVAAFHGLFSPASNLQSPKITAKVLALHGYDDPMVKPADLLAFATEMSAAGADWQIHAYGHTLHAFTNPEAQNPAFGTQYEPKADRRSFAALKDFLAETFA